MERRRVALVVVRSVAVILGALVVTWFALPSPIGSLPWIPSPAPALDGPYKMNELLTSATWQWPEAVGAEDTAADADGRLYSGLSDGRVVRLEPGGATTTIVQTGGRPLGLQFSKADGLLYVCDTDKGLLAVDVAKKTFIVVTDTAEGDAFSFTNNLAIDSAGRVYFTDASSVWRKHQYTEDLLDQRPTGRVMRYDPRTKETTVLVRELSFANGVALMPDERSLIVAETGRYRLWRVWLEGDKKNLKEVLIENLPGFPDNIDVSPRGTVWVAMASTRKRLLDIVHPHPFFKDTLASLPKAVRPKGVRWGFVLEVDGEGRPLRSLQDPSGNVVWSVTSARERNGVLHLGTLDDAGVATVRIPW